MNKEAFPYFLKSAFFYWLFVSPLILIFVPAFSSAMELNLNFEEGGVSIFVLTFLGGVLTSLTPCVLPMIPITLSLIGTNKTSSNYESFILSLFYVLGISTVYSLLGLTAATTGSLFGVFLSYPVTKIFFALLFVLLALSLFGWFELKTPRFIEQRLDRLLSRHQRERAGIGVAFLSGGIAGLIASPCVGPVLASLLLYVSHSQDLMLGFFLLFTFSLGLGQIFLLLGAISQRTLPRLGAWSKRLKNLLGFILLLFALNFVFPFSKQQNLLSLFSFSLNKNHSAMSIHLKKKFAYGNQWIKFSKDHIKKAKEEGKPVILYFYADWCAACHRLQKETFISKKVQEMGTEFLWLKVDLSTPSEEQNRITKHYKVLGLPQLMFYNTKGVLDKQITLTGFESEEDFLTRMQKALTSSPTKTKFME